jgi:hypothetical protein
MGVGIMSTRQDTHPLVRAIFGHSFSPRKKKLLQRWPNNRDSTCRTKSRTKASLQFYFSIQLLTRSILSIITPTPSIDTESPKRARCFHFSDRSTSTPPTEAPKDQILLHWPSRRHHQRPPSWLKQLPLEYKPCSISRAPVCLFL